LSNEKKMTGKILFQSIRWSPQLSASEGDTSFFFQGSLEKDGFLFLRPVFCP